VNAEEDDDAEDQDCHRRSPRAGRFPRWYPAN